MIAVINCGSSKTPLIAQHLEEYQDVQVIGLLDFSTEILNQFTGVVISGAPILLTEIDPAPYLQKLSWIKTYQKPILGICFGHQLIGLLHGARIAKMKEDRDFQEIEVLKDDLIFDRLPDIFEMQEDHCEAINLPNEFKLLASSSYSEVEVMKHLEKKIYGCQFHPEVSSIDGEKFIANFLKS